jgi:hypothetical protein
METRWVVLIVAGTIAALLLLGTGLALASNAFSSISARGVVVVTP